ncbi:SDR family oxidoreductase [Hirschia litorea]|uniref:SDR family oxidoreductase n=1 Tax=Hirschia litorea TaxID=1199156 RepID=A0ABW2IQ72_9PROT
MDLQLAGKTIIVTGSSSGIGAAIAKAAYDEGANVMLHGTKEAVLQEKAAELGPRANWVAADLADVKSASVIANKTKDVFGTIDGLVNNAGVFPRSSVDTDVPEHFDFVFHVNVRSPLMLTQELVKVCREESKAGSVVNIGSINAHCGAPFLLMYAMSKGAMMTMSRNLGDALGIEKIRVNQLNVGWTYTEGERKIQADAGAPDDWQDHLSPLAAPSGKLLQPEDVAAHAVFWLSPLSAPVNGTIHTVEQFPMTGRNRNSG